MTVDGSRSRKHEKYNLFAFLRVSPELQFSQDAPPAFRAVRVEVFLRGRRAPHAFRAKLAKNITFGLGSIIGVAHSNSFINYVLTLNIKQQFIE